MGSGRSVQIASQAGAQKCDVREIRSRLVAPCLFQLEKVMVRRTPGFRSFDLDRSCVVKQATEGHRQVVQQIDL
jgi:hypothetical protein